MSAKDRPDDARLSPSLEGRIDEACDRYEAAWKVGEAPEIETYLDLVPDTERSPLFRQLLALELELRSRRGERPDCRNYLARFSAHAAIVREVFLDSTGREAAPPATSAVSATGASPRRLSFTETRSLLRQAGEEKQFGRYRLLRILGQGAFGRVHLAFDQELKRQVAIKEPNPERFREPGDAEVYLAEARIAATLDHPNIVPVYDVGRTAEGSVYVVSKFVEGQTLADRIDDRPTIDESTRLVATVARALGHAHRKRLVHRDVKPANILLEEATGTPYVADFGLAIREEDTLSEGTIAGTPSYMSPEQVRGEGHRLDGRSDLFSLGVIFYELLTGKRPFRGSTMMEIFHQVISDDPAPPRSHDEAIPAELERICLKALSKRASDRYAAAAEMAEDLEHWAEDPRIGRKQVAIVPRGLRSFGPDDADFFLELLPGPRGRDGLPESIRFWKARIEETDPDRTFDVGLIYGPSGCGKSSLMKAGLLPHLPASIAAIYVEATAEDTETRILRGLRKHFPELPEGLGLVETFLSLRRGGSTQDRKVVVVLDQFEQWLHARRGDQETELVGALRQCDGGRLQAIVMVRDDFSMAASRFMRELEAPIVEGHNFATIDLFEHGHAVKVLAKFGQAFGRLPAQPGAMTAAEGEFLDRVVSGLAQDGKIVSVRLALFAEMVKDKPWIPATLDEVGGTEGIGVNFLEESFSGRKANPEHCHHQQAARQVLKALLPEVGTDIKGHMRSHVELLAASGYADRPGEFRDVLRILDGSLRLITPTDPDGSRSDSGSDPGAKFYQLTHDYLVPSLREWLTRKQKETRQGRAELRLAELAALWNARPENRRLPSLGDYRNIRRFVASRSWTSGQKVMMQQAGLYHAQALVRRLLEADLRDVPAIVDQVRQLRRYCVPLLRAEQRAAADPSPARLHTALALLPLDEAQIDYLYERLLKAEAADFPVVRDALAPHRRALSARLWEDATSGEDEDRRFHAAAALASYEPAHPGWRDIREEAARSLTLVKPEFLGDWKDALRPVQAELLGPLSTIFRDHELGELQLALATSSLADYAADDVRLLADLICDATPQQFASLFPVLARHDEAAVAELERELDEEVNPDWADAPPDPAYCAVPAAIERALEVALGTVTPHFALCQGMAQARFREVVEELGRCGYRPTRVRPYLAGRSLLMTAAWIRDGRPWQWLSDADPAQLRSHDAELRQQGYVPIDVSVASPRRGAGPRYTAVWEKAEIGETEARLMAGPLDEEADRAHATLVEEKFNCLVASVVLDDEGHPHGGSLWTRRKGQQKSTSRVFHGPAEDFHEDDCPGFLLTDARLARPPGRDDGQAGPLLLTSALWNISTEYESKVLHALTPEELRERIPRLAAAGYRPASISAVGEGEGD